MKLLLLLAAAALGLFAWHSEWDLAISGYFFNGDFFLKNAMVVRFIYRAVFVLTYALSAAYIAALIWRKFFVNRKVFGCSAPDFRVTIFLMLALAMGPGLVVHEVAKEFFERPRPREVVEFGGEKPFVPVLEKSDFNGKAFPSGHAATGFYMMIFGMLATTRRKKHALYAAGFLFGTVVGLGRMAQGGHFASDILGSLIVVLMVNGLLYRVMFRGK